MADTFDEVKSVIFDVMKNEEKLKKEGKTITLETRFIEDLSADSMDQFFLIDGFSEKFDLTISDDEARAIRTVGDAVTYIDSHKK